MEMNYKKHDRFEIFVRVSKVISPIFRLAFYVLAFFAVLLLMVALIVVFVNVPTEDMMLPPFMHAVRDEADALVGYNIMVGNGIRMYAEYDTVELGDIKTVIYAGIFVAVAVMLVAAPICRFFGELLKNVSKRRPLDPDNAKLISFVGIILTVGSPLVLFVKRFYNYYLVHTFITDGTNMELSLGFDFTSMVFGLIIMFFGLLYSYAVKQYAELTPPSKDGQNVPNIEDTKRRKQNNTDLVKK